jgi:predicted nucleotidyltransferase
MPKVLSGSVKFFYPDYKPPELAKLLRDRLQGLDEILTLRRVVLFGSWTKGKETAFSDIDLLIIYTGPPREDAYRLVKQYMNLRGLEPHVFSEEETENLEMTLARMTKGGVVLYPE